MDRRQYRAPRLPGGRRRGVSHGWSSGGFAGPEISTGPDALQCPHRAQPTLTFRDVPARRGRSRPPAWQSSHRVPSPDSWEDLPGLSREKPLILLAGVEGLPYHPKIGDLTKVRQRDMPQIKCL